MKFPIPNGTAVYTTKFVIENKHDILSVIHDKDGDWQFFSDDDYEHFGEVAKLVSLEQILQIDPSLIKLADMPRNKIATRKNINSKWTITEISE